MNLEFLYALPRYPTYVALLAWAIVFVGLVGSPARAVSAGDRSPSRGGK